MTSASSRGDHFGYLSPPPNYQHSPPSVSASFSSFQFDLAPTKSENQSTRSNSHQNDSLASATRQQQQQDEHYLAKYKDMKQKLKDLELDNDRLHLKCLVVRKNIQRLRLERAILYERLQAMGGAPASNNHSIPQNLPQSNQHMPTRHDSDPNQALDHEQPPLSRFQSTFMVKRTSSSSSALVARSPNKRSATIPSSSSAPVISLSQLPSSSGQKQNVTTIAENGPAPSPTLHEVRNGNFMRTFPFVHEYSSSSTTHNKPQRQSTPIHSEYPVEIKFHQYEAGPPDQRTRRDGDEKSGGGGKQKRRASASQSQDLSRTQRSSSKRHPPTTFRGPFTYSFQVQPTPPENISPIQPTYPQLTR